MSSELIHSSNEELPEDILARSTENLIRLQSKIHTTQDYYDLYDEVETACSDIRLALGSDSVLIVTSNSLLTPVFDTESGRYRIDSSSDIVELEFDDIICANAAMLNENSEPTLFYRLKAGELYHEDQFHKSDTEYYILAPVARSSVSIPVSLEIPLVLEDDDEIAGYIDELILNTPIDLAGLSQLVTDEFPYMNDLQQEKYLKQINTLCNFGYVEALAPKYLIIDIDQGSAALIEAEDGGEVFTGSFQEFDTILIVDDDTSLSSEQLMMIIQSPYGYAGILVNDIADIKLSSKN